jgi:hypothetical protein
MDFDHRRLLRVGRWLAAALALGAMAVTAVALGAVQERANTTIPPQQLGSATAKCDPGEVALAAGFGASPFDPNGGSGGPVARLGSMPAGKHRIKTTAMNFNNSATGTLYSYAYCGKRAKPPTVASSDVQVDPNTVGSAVAKCPEGSRSIAGGFGIDDQTFIITLVSKRSGNRGWKVAGFNIGDQSSAPGRLTAYAYCKSPGPKITTESKDTTVSNGLKTTNVNCPNGGKAISGGFDGNISSSGSQLNAAGALTSKRFDKARGWTTEALSSSSPNQATITTYAYCRG